MDDIDALLGRAWRDDAPADVVTRLAEIDNRMGGHPGERAAAEVAADALADAGLSPELRTFETHRWTRGTTDLAVGDRSFDAVALPYSPAGDVTGELVDAGHGTPEEIDDRDVEGTVVVASTDTPSDRRFLHRMEKFGHAVDGGAAAFVFANHLAGQLPPTGSLRFGREAAIPGVGVSKETGAWLREYADDGRPASLRVEADTDDAESVNVVAETGPATDEAVLAVAHHDAHDVGEGALDNGCGVAVLVGAARLLAAMDLDRRVVLATVGCEETGLGGSAALAAERDPAAVVNVDGAGRERDLRAFVHGSDAMAALARDVCEGAGHPVHIQELPHAYSDHWPFLRRGTPALQLHSQPPDGAARGRGWTHTHADTREKVDERDLRGHAMLTALLVRELAARVDDVPPVDTDALRETLREAGAESGMRAAGVWPDDWE